MAAGPKRVLIVEDEVLIALHLEDMLTEIGHEVVGHASRIESALELADKADVDFAVLDINLAGAESFPVADVLRGRGIPFIFATAYQGLMNQEYGDEVLLKKPYAPHELEIAMERAFARADR